MSEYDMKGDINVWKASITSQQMKESQNVSSFVSNVQTKITANQVPTTIENLEKYTISVMKNKTYQRILKEIEILISYLSDVANKFFPPEAVQSASYLTACTILDPLDLSKESMQKIIKKMDISQPTTDHATLICYGKLKPSQEDVISQTQELIKEVNDDKGLLWAVLMSSEKYKAKIVLLQQINNRQNGNFPNANNMNILLSFILSSLKQSLPNLIQ